MKNWYKIASVLLILYTIFWGLLGPVPRLDILNETIRNLYYHVPIWFAMILMMTKSVFHSLIYLSTNKIKQDIKAADAAIIGFVLSIPGIITGSVWAKFTWGAFWVKEDPKLNGAALAILIYLGYLVLRSAFNDEIKRARFTSVFNIFAYVLLIVFIFIYPRMHSSLHPGNGGNPAFGKYDLDNNMRLVFYPAVMGWMMFSWWLYNIKNRISIIKTKLHE